MIVEASRSRQHYTQDVDYHSVGGSDHAVKTGAGSAGVVEADHGHLHHNQAEHFHVAEPDFAVHKADHLHQPLLAVHEDGGLG